MRVVKILPIRLQSSRFPNKPLATVMGRTLVESGLAVCQQINGGDTVLTATEEDFDEIRRRLDLGAYKFRYIPSSDICRCATERVLEIYNSIRGDLFVSIPVDETAALIPREVSRVLRETEKIAYSILTLYCEFFSLADARSTLSAKVVMNRGNELLYMSRSPIPLLKSGELKLEFLKKHVGLYFYRRAALDRLQALRDVPTQLDTLEGLEQLRWLELGMTVQLQKIRHIGFGIDVPDQIPLLEERLRKLSILPDYRDAFGFSVPSPKRA